ncbi:hypothetical protein RND71_040658 [Anisodus tanguticus]|uniref:Nicastrin n=1 Tax=Anisodus tanguticus TaxID=243964 RepID=A0AAE1QTU0_9SOLA|nr:hypothetical protein RND71_040658 [Anisodus tanguticus]
MAAYGRKFTFGGEVRPPVFNWLASHWSRGANSQSRGASESECCDGKLESSDLWTDFSHTTFPCLKHLTSWTNISFISQRNLTILGPTVIYSLRRSCMCEETKSPTCGTLVFNSSKMVDAFPRQRQISNNNIGWLPGLKVDGDSNQLPTIAIVASYDTFGAAPTLSLGRDSNGSGAVALLEIARLFSALYSNPKTRGRYNLLFGLTSGGPYNYNGTQKVHSPSLLSCSYLVLSFECVSFLQWLRSFDQRLRESIDYAICLNSDGSLSNQLHLHVSKPPENDYIQQIFQGFSTVAEELGLQVGLKHKKINISNPRLIIFSSFISLAACATTFVMGGVQNELKELQRLRDGLPGLSKPAKGFLTWNIKLREDISVNSISLTEWTGAQKSIVLMHEVLGTGLNEYRVISEARVVIRYCLF